MDNIRTVISSKGSRIPRPFRTSSLPISFALLVCVSFFPILQGCPQDKTPLLQEENGELKKLTAKQDSMIITLQEGNRVMQEQVDRLNQELREEQKEQEEKLKSAQETGQGLATERHALTQRVTELTKENQKLKNDAQWLRRQLQEEPQTLSYALDRGQGVA